jgi:hypothetical protein
VQTVQELRAKAAELRRIADKLDAAAVGLFELGASTAYGAHIVPGGDLSHLSGIDAMERVLIESKTPLTKAEIFERLKERGKAIGENTLESYLSRAKNRFTNHGRGYWTVPGAMAQTTLFPGVRVRRREEASH